MTHESLLDRLGGPVAIEAAVYLFYDKIMAEPRLAPLFEGMNVKRIRDHQIEFMKTAFGEERTHKGRSLTDAHKRLVKDKGLSDEHFDLVAQKLQETLKELHIPANLANEVLGIVASTRDDVLGR